MARRRPALDLTGKPPATAWGLLATIATVAVGTLVVWPLKSVAPPVSLSVVYIPGVLLIATIWGWRLGVLSAVASALAFNW
ncbi:MAG TPA: DUF4118 domain-containing protein, partial [Solirubrobacterales bacterium]|nr:DUF4118 domain-containing protein [Solirubrobacterales bacterium]